MEAKVSVHGEVAIIHLSGRIDFDSHDVFRSACLSRKGPGKVVFDLSRLDFVGSNAITPFVKTLSELSQRSDGVRLFGVGPEFRKIFSSSPIHSLEIFEDQRNALESFI